MNSVINPPSAQPSSDAGATDSRDSRQLGDYELLRKLGKGAMGSVFLARQNTTGRMLALKVLSPEMARDPEFIERFRREAKAATKFDHPNLIKAYEVGVASGFHFIAMEYADRGDLETDLESRPDGRFRSREVLRIAKDIACALINCHELGIVHRDIKPANILLHSDGNYKLTDLGLAARRKDDVEVTKPGNAVGTPFYISPEQAQGEQHVNIASDIYSLGATLYHLVTGELPFRGENGVVVMTRHIVEPLVPPRNIQPRVPLPLSRLIEKMMAKRPQDRHQTPLELLEDIELIERGGMPLLRRARARAHTSGTSMYEMGLIDDPPENLQGRSRGGRRKALAPRKSLHPRHSRYPKGRKRYAKDRTMGTIFLVGLLLLAVAIIGGVLAGYGPDRLLEVFGNSPQKSLPLKSKSKSP